MALSPEQVAHLLSLPDKRRAGRKKGPDTTVRDHTTWFKLAHKLFDEDTRELVACSNPDCPDTRDKAKSVVAEVDGVLMCRICFLAGWKSILPMPGQQSMVK